MSGLETATPQCSEWSFPSYVFCVQSCHQSSHCVIFDDAHPRAKAVPDGARLGEICEAGERESGLTGIFAGCPAEDYVTSNFHPAEPSVPASPGAAKCAAIKAGLLIEYANPVLTNGI